MLSTCKCTFNKDMQVIWISITRVCLQVCLQKKVEKIKTIGDCYMCVAWTAEPLTVDARADSARRVMEVVDNFHAYIAMQPVDVDSGPLAIRAGVHAGQVVSGIIGRTKFCYDIWGVRCCATGAGGSLVRFFWFTWTAIASKCTVSSQ